jgi:hypothetical protein
MDAIKKLEEEVDVMEEAETSADKVAKEKQNRMGKAKQIFSNPRSLLH